MELTAERQCWLVLAAEGSEEMAPEAVTGEIGRQLEAKESSWVCSVQTLEARLRSTGPPWCCFPQHHFLLSSVKESEIEFRLGLL